MPICSNSSEEPYTVISKSHESGAEYRLDFRVEKSPFGMQETWRLKADSSIRPCIICPCSDRIRPFNRGSPVAVKFSEESNATSNEDTLSLEFSLSHLPEIPET